MDLNAPLGMSPPPEPPRRPRRVPTTVALAIGSIAAVGILAVAGLYLVNADPRGGEPYGVAAIPPIAPKPVRLAAPAAQPDPSATASLPPATRTTTFAPQAAQPQPAGGPLVIDVAKVLAERRQGTSSTLVASAEPAAAGRSDARARPAGDAAAPRIAILVASMGLGPSATRTATEIMPAAVSFAFVPYGEAVGAAVAAAKAKGHEILLQVPMQTTGAPAPGPHALRAGEPAAEVGVDIAWAMGRFSGYAGVANFLGAAVTADKPVMDALLKAVAARNLFYIDDGTSRRSLGSALAQQEGLPAGRADVVLDATADPAVVRANLETLAAIARRKGAAIGLASGLPDHLAAIAAFAAGLGARNIALVPVGALVTRTPSMAVAQ